MEQMSLGDSPHNGCSLAAEKLLDFKPGQY